MTDMITPLFLYPFDKEQLPLPNDGQNILFWNIQYNDALAEFSNFDVVQNFKPYVDVWNAYDVDVSPILDEAKNYHTIFCALPKQKEQALYMIGRALHQLHDKGLLLCIAANDAGGKNIEKWMKGVGLTPQSLSKNKCRIVWAYKQDVNKDAVFTYIEGGSPMILGQDDLNFATQAGIYGWNKIDRGSKLLIDNLPNSITGKGADFGAGYGYLSHQILTHQKINTLDVIEADYNALLCAQENLKDFTIQNQVNYQWFDLSKDIPAGKNLDFIIMNPPFHEGKQTKHSLGQTFITNAAKALRAGGWLYMVANIQLPYERVLEQPFTHVEKICQEQGYKILFAQK